MRLVRFDEVFGFGLRKQYLSVIAYLVVPGYVERVFALEVIRRVGIRVIDQVLHSDKEPDSSLHTSEHSRKGLGIFCKYQRRHSAFAVPHIPFDPNRRVTKPRVRSRLVVSPAPIAENLISLGYDVHLTI